MALITCSECGKEISDQAASCVHCGCPVEAPNEFPEDKIREIGGIMVNIDELIREHGRDNVAMAKHLKTITGVRLSEAKRITDIAFRNRDIKPLGFFERSQLESVAITPIDMQNDSKLQKLEMKSKKLEIKQQKQTIKDQKKTARCPKCGSTSLSAHKKGFGIGKALVGSAATNLVGLGLIGAVAGNAGAKKVRVTCLNCGKQFWT